MRPVASATWCWMLVEMGTLTADDCEDRLRQLLQPSGGDDELDDARTGRGQLMLYNPAGLKASGIDMIVLGGTVRAAARAALIDYPRRLAEIVERIRGR